MEYVIGGVIGIVVGVVVGVIFYPHFKTLVAAVVSDVKKDYDAAVSRLDNTYGKVVDKIRADADAAVKAAQKERDEAKAEVVLLKDKVMAFVEGKPQPVAADPNQATLPGLSVNNAVPLPAASVIFPAADPSGVVQQPG